MSENVQFVVKFDYNTKILNDIVDEAKSIDVTNIEEVAETVKKLVKIRREIQSQGKGFREEAIAYNNSVLTEEKEYVKIIETVELEYKELLKKDEERKIIEVRKELLPMKRKQLESLNHRPARTDEFLLEMDDTAWVNFYNQEFELNEFEEKEIANAKQRKLDQEKREEEIKREAADKAAKDAEQAAIRAEEDKQRAVQKIKEEIAAKELKDLADAKAKEKAKELEKEKLEADKKYQQWLDENNYVAGNGMKLQETEDYVLLYQFVSKFKK